MPFFQHTPIVVLATIFLALAAWLLIRSRPKRPFVGHMVVRDDVFLLGPDPSNPNPITINLPLLEARDCFISAIGQVQSNRHWIVANHADRARSITATISFSEKLSDRPDVMITTMSLQQPILNTVLTLQCEFTAQGHKTLAKWVYTVETTSAHMDTTTLAEPQAKQLFAYTNYSILHYFGMSK